MADLNSVLAPYYRPRESLGGGAPIKTQAKDALGEHSRLTHRLYGAIFAATGALLLGLVVVTAVDIFNGNSRYGIVTAATGLTIPFLLTFLIKTSKEWIRTDLFNALFSGADESTARELIRLYVESSSRNEGNKSKVASQKVGNPVS